MSTNTVPPEEMSDTEPGQSAGLKPFEQWALEKHTDVHLLAAAKAVGHWAIGKELTEQEYDAGLAMAAGATMGG